MLGTHQSAVVADTTVTHTGGEHPAVHDGSTLTPRDLSVFFCWRKNTHTSVRSVDCPGGAHIGTRRGGCIQNRVAAYVQRCIRRSGLVVEFRGIFSKASFPHLAKVLYGETYCLLETLGGHAPSFIHCGCVVLQTLKQVTCTSGTVCNTGVLHYVRYP